IQLQGVVANGTQPRVLLGHSDSVNSLAFSVDGKWLVSAGEDGSTLIWDTESGKQVATLLSVRGGDDWLAGTPDGLFEGSPAAWNEILWRFAGNTFNVAPVETFFNEFYYPGLLAEIFGRKHPRAPQAISEKDRRQPRVNLSLVSAANDGRVATRTVTVKIDLA